MKILKTFLPLLLLLFSINAYSQTITSCVTGTISVTGDPDLELCQGDGLQDRIRFRTQPFATPVAYIVVDENDIIVHAGISNFVDFENLPNGNLRVFSVSFIGQFLGEVGDNYLETPLGSFCFQLSQNFIAVSNLTPVGGMVATDSGATEVTVCIDPDGNSVLNIETDVDFQPYLFVITDDSNNILGTSPDGAIDFAPAGAGVCRVWGLAYVGQYTGEVGDNILTTDLGSGCFELSSNYVEVTRLSPDAGDLTYADGSTSFTSCSVLEPTGTLSLLSTNNPATAFTFVFVDNETGLVTNLTTATTIDLAAIATGSYTIYGVSYTGNLLATVGSAFDVNQVSDECFDLADNSLTLIKRVQNADDVMLEDGSSTVTLCVGDGVDDFLTFTTTYAGNDNFTYIITNEGNFVLGVSDDPTINFEGAGAGICRVWGLAYSGNLLVEEGINIGPPTLLSDECFDLSDGFVLVNRNGPQGGDILYADGTDSFVSCSTLAPTGTLTFTVTNNDADSEYAFFLVNNDDNTVAAIVTGSTIDLESLTAGGYTVYGVSYLDDLAVTVGDDFDPATVGGSCFDLADNRLSLIVRTQDAGDVTLEGGATETTVCVGDGVPDPLTFNSTYVGNDNFVYVVTNANNIVISISTDATIDFEGSGIGIRRVWGLVYSGNLTLEVGDNLNAGQALSDECFDLSNSFVRVNRDGPQGGTIAYANGSDTFISCTPLPPNGFVIFTNDGNAPTDNYAYILVNNDDNTIALITQTPLILANIPLGSFTVYGVSYSDNLAVSVGDTFDATVLSTGCFDVADNTLVLVKRIQNADDVTYADGSSEATICVGDGNPDVLTFASNYTGNDDFVFVITDESNFVLDTSTDGVIDFENSGAGICRVWGLVYSGNLTLEVGDNLAGGQDLSDECFDLSDGFAVVNRNGPDGGTIALEGGATEYVECMAGGGTTLTLVSTDADPNLAFVYIIVDAETDLIVNIQGSTGLNLDDLGPGTYTVYGLSYLENLSVNVGDTFTGAVLADECFDLSDNTVSITNRAVSLNLITFEDGSTVAAICPDDDTADLLNFLTDYTGDDNLAFVVTDTSNVIIELLSGASTDFENYDGDFVRVYGIAFSGNFLLQNGLDLDDAPAISDDCFDLSNNFLVVDLRGPDGGELILANGETTAAVCVSDGIADVLSVQTTAPNGSEYVYLVTDENNIILSISDSPFIDFEEAPAGVCRIWGLAYLGNLLAAPGDDAATAMLASECFDLSDNFIVVTRTFVDGGTVSLEDGSTLTFACSNDGVDDFFIFTNTSAATDTDYGYIITNNQGSILAVLEGNSVDLDQAAPGQCRVYGFSYSGTTIAEVGQIIGEVALSDACFELSSNFISVQRDEVDGGTVSLEDGSTTLNICPDDGVEDFLSFVNNGSSTASYTYVLTDVNNNVISNIGLTPVDFSAIAVPAEVRVWGVAFSGLISLPTGDLEGSDLSNRCYDLSDNFVTIIREQPAGGDVTTTDEETALFLCTDDGLSDLYAFQASGVSNTDYAFLVTDDNNIILEVLTNTNEVDFEGVATGVCRVWGVAYTGNLLATVGDDAGVVALSDDCFDLSSSFVTVTRGELNAGTVASTIGDGDRYTCPGDGNADVLTFSNQGTGSGTFAFVLTDADNIIVEILTGNTYDFETLAEGEYRLHGLVYTGDLLADVGSDAAADELATGCYDLSDNFITIFNITPAAGAVFTEDGEGEIMICIGDGIPDPFDVIVFGASDANYTFLVVDEDSILVGILNEPTFDFEQAAPGDWRIYGLSYTGSLGVLPGANIYEEDLASGCYDLSNTFVLVDKTEVDGGEVFTEEGSQVVYACPDGIADVVSFINSGTSTEDDYTYVLTTQTNIVLQILTGNSVDLEDAAGLDQLRMWGVSFTGDLSFGIGNTLTQVALSDGCNDLSNSFVDIFIGDPEGGTLSYADGTDTTRLCHSNSMPGIQVNTTSTANVGYAYIVTDLMNNVLQVTEPADGVVNFDDLAPGTYHIWAVSYTGTLLVQAGDDVTTTDLATSCFDLSDNFVVLERTESLDAGNVSTIEGDDIVYICPQDGMADIVILDNDTDDPNYRYIITDSENNILFGDIESNIIDFDPSAPGICRVYGVVYTGEFDPQFMADITTSSLSTDCWAISNNYVTLVRQTPDGGIVTTDEGSIDVEVFVEDGEADVVTFINTGIPLTTYAYVVTDEDNVILDLSIDGVIDFEGSTPGVCRVWGLSYTGNIIAMIGEDADEVLLTDDCFDLSDNFVTVSRIEDGGFAPEQTELTIPGNEGEVSISLYPNPASDVLNLQVSVPANLQTGQQLISCYDLNGALLFQQPLAATGSQQRALDVSQLQAGIYLLRWYDGERVITKRFVKN